MLVIMSCRRFLGIVSLVALTGCSTVRQAITTTTSTPYHPVARATVWPAPGGDLRTCAPGTPTGDAPMPRGPADTVQIRNKTVRQVLSTLCSFSVTVPKANNGRSKDHPLQ